MTLEPGDVVLVPFPFTDPSSAKTRPALVLSTARFNRGKDVILCAITSNLENTGQSVLVRTNDLKSGRLPADSRIKVGKLATIQQSLVRRRVGAVRGPVLAQVLKELYSVLPAPAP